MNNVVVKFGSKSLASVLKDGYALIIMFTCYVAGVFTGVFSLVSSDTVLKKSELIYSDYILGRSDKKFLSIFATSLTEWLPYILFIFVAGLCIAGMAIIPIFVFAKGFSYGLLAGYLYSIFAFKGIIFVLILIIPCTLVGAFSLFIAAKQAGEFSLSLAKSILPQTNSNSLYPRFTLYCREFVFLSLLSLVVALIDALLCRAFFDTINLL